MKLGRGGVQGYFMIDHCRVSCTYLDTVPAGGLVHTLQMVVTRDGERERPIRGDPNARGEGCRAVQHAAQVALLQSVLFRKHTSLLRK